MAITKRRVRVVVFRVTDREFAALHRVCEANGGRNLSEFARTELLKSALSIEAAALSRQLGLVERSISRLETGCKYLMSRASQPAAADTGFPS
jgi:hypothetical protein